MMYVPDPLPVLVSRKLQPVVEDIAEEFGMTSAFISDVQATQDEPPYGHYEITVVIRVVCEERIMKVENLKRVVRVKKELEQLESCIKTLEKYKDKSNKLGFNISEYFDHSGFSLPIQFKNGNYHPMYEEIYEFIHQKFIEARDELLEEIESL